MHWSGYDFKKLTQRSRVFHGDLFFSNDYEMRVSWSIKRKQNGTIISTS